MTLSREGDVVAREWSVIPQIGSYVVLDEWIVMPDHLHGIFIFRNSPELREEVPLSLGEVIAQFKSRATKTIRWDLKRRRFAWQERYHDTILREPADLERVREYIRTNPARWKAR